MKSYTQSRTNYGIETKNTTTANLTYGDDIMNQFHRKILSKADWPFLHRLRTALTVASTTFVPLAYDVDLVESVFVTVGSTRYNPKPAPNREFWDRLHYNTYTSSIPQYWFVFDGQLGLWPQSASSDNVISMNCKIRVRDLNIADITSTTIATLTNGSQSLTVSGGLTTQMTGFWIRPTFSTTANTGDGQWYELSSVASATTATLVRKYGGTSISVGSAACTISQMSLLPEAYDHLPVTYGAYRYWLKEKDSRANGFKEMLIEDTNEMFRSYGFNDLSMVLDDGREAFILNPNLTVSL